MRSRRSEVVLVEGREKAMVRLSEMPGKVSTRMLVVAIVLLNARVREGRRRGCGANPGACVGNIKNNTI